MQENDEEDPGFLDFVQNLLIPNSFPVTSHTRRVKERVKNQVRQRRADFKRVRTNIDPKVEQVRQRALQQFDKVDQAFAKAVDANQTEMVWYTLTLLNILAIGMAIAAKPELIPQIYTAELMFLLPIRFWYYNRQNWQFYLADLCYYVNGLLVLYLWVWPQSQSLWISCFAFSYGSLAASVILWRNSLVLQSIDKTTSSFIHIMPPLVMYCIKFRLNEAIKTQKFPGAHHVDKWNSVHSVVITTLAYFVWQSAYHYFITVRKADKIKNGTITSFEFMRHRYAKTRLGKFVNGLPGPLPVLAFTLIQFTFQMVTMAPCPLYYMHEWLSVALLVTIFATASYNGASYYIEVYGKRFHKQLVKLQQELDKEDDKEDDKEEDKEDD